MNNKGLQWLFTKRILFRITLGAILTVLLVFVFTSTKIIKPYYQSETLIYVPLTILAKQIEQQGIGFASDVEIDGHIQILQSTHMRDSLIARFRFDQELNVSLDELGAKSQLYHFINQQIDIRKTRYNSVSVKVRDHDPIRAAAIANAIVELGDVIKEDILRANRKEVYLHALTHYESKEKSLAELEKKIDSIENILPKSKIPQATMNELSKLKTLYSFELQELAGRKNHLETIQRGFNTALPKSYIISEAFPEITPVWPKRKLWAAIAALTYIAVVVIVEVIRRDVA